MSDDKLIHPPAIGAGASSHLPVEHSDAAPPMLPEEHYYPAAMEAGSGGIDIRRYLLAILRYKWLLALALVVGLTGAYLVWTNTPVTYTAEGNLWIEVASTQGGGGDVTPIRASGLLESNAWIELLRSYQVLDTVAVRERLNM